ncbi:hypothetical protein GJ496_009737 [Pomphorhynchus laevis]|nr:hypothetical protein GJ496_009737 [Pomphorhynchus laevis]
MSFKLLEKLPDLLCKLSSRKNELVIVVFDLENTKAGQRMVDRILADPIEPKVSTEYVKINVKTVPECSSKYNIIGVPTMCAFVKGNEIGRLVGLKTKAEIKELINTVAKNAEENKSDETAIVNLMPEDDIEQIMLCAKDSLLVVDFYADWCIPCHLLKPILETAVIELIQSGNELSMLKIDVTQYPELAMTYDADALPYVAVFHNMKKINYFEGLQNREQVTEFLNESIKMMADN